MKYVSLSSDINHLNAKQLNPTLKANIKFDINLFTLKWKKAA